MRRCFRKCGSILHLFLCPAIVTLHPGQGHRNKHEHIPFFVIHESTVMPSLYTIIISPIVRDITITVHAGSDRQRLLYKLLVCVSSPQMQWALLEHLVK